LGLTTTSQCAEMQGSESLDLKLPCWQELHKKDGMDGLE